MFTPLTPIDWKRRAVKYYPDKTAVIDSEKRFTYKEFGERCDRLSVALVQEGIRNGDHVAVMLPNTHAMVECFYGICQLGAAIVPLNYRLKAEDLQYILNHSDAKMLIVDEAYAPPIEKIIDELPNIEKVVVVAVDGFSNRLEGKDYEALLEGVPADAKPPEVALDENQLLSLNYTSGTTSNPKGVMQTHRGNYMNAADFTYHLNVRPEDVYLHTLPLFHCNGWGGIWAITAAAATHVCLRHVDPPHILELFEREQVSLLCGAPTVINMMVNAPEAVEAEINTHPRLATAGSPPAAAVIQRAQDLLGLKIIHTYGLTETSPFILYCEWKPEFDEQPLEAQATIKSRQGIEMIFNGETKVVGEDGREVAWDGEKLGEIVTRGNVVMDGYYKDPEKTAEAVKGGWFYTGDLAVTHPDGYIEIRDRAKDLIISGGENISSTEVEGELYKHPNVQEAAVIAIPDEKWGEIPKAMLVLQPGTTASENEIISFCRERLAHFKAPKQVAFVERLPKTATGKMQKFRLRAEHWQSERKVN